MEQFTLKFSKVRDKTLDAISIAQKEHNRVVAGMTKFRIKIHAMIIFEFILKVLLLSGTILGLCYLSGMNVTKYVVMADSIIVLAFMVYYDLKYNRVSVTGIDGEIIKNKNTINALAKFTRSTIGRLFPSILEGYLYDLKELAEKSQNCTNGLNQIGQSLSILTFGFIQTLFSIPDSKMYYYNTSKSELTDCFKKLPRNFILEYNESLNEIKRIVEAYENSTMTSEEVSAILNELGMPLNVAVLQQYCRKGVLTRNDLSKFIDLNKETEKLLYSEPIQDKFYTNQLKSK